MMILLEIILRKTIKQKRTNKQLKYLKELQIIVLFHLILSEKHQRKKLKQQKNLLILVLRKLLRLLSNQTQKINIKVILLTHMMLSLNLNLKKIKQWLMMLKKQLISKQNQTEKPSQKKSEEKLQLVKLHHQQVELDLMRVLEIIKDNNQTFKTYSLQQYDLKLIIKLFI